MPLFDPQRQYIQESRLVGDRLIRKYDGDETTVARKVVYAGFSRSGKILKLTLTVQAAQGDTETKSLEVYGRMLQ